MLNDSSGHDSSAWTLDGAGARQYWYIRCLHALWYILGLRALWYILGLCTPWYNPGLSKDQYILGLSTCPYILGLSTCPYSLSLLFRVVLWWYHLLLNVSSGHDRRSLNIGVVCALQYQFMY